MCIIFFNENGVAYDEGELRRARARNSDGCGVMWFQDGKVETMKGMWTADELVNLMKDFVGVPHALHLRFATHGGSIPALCHPFRMSPEDLDGVYVMHNGVMHEQGCRAGIGESDTLVFARDCAELAAEHGTTDILFDDETVDGLETIVGSDRVIYFRDDGSYEILNPDNWYVDEETGIWYSNQYSVKQYSYQGSTYKGSWNSSKGSWSGSHGYNYTSNTPTTPATPSKSAEDSASVFENLETVDVGAVHGGSCVCDECLEWASYKKEYFPDEVDEDGNEVCEVAVSLDTNYYLRWDADEKEFQRCFSEDADIAVSAEDYEANWANWME